MPPPPSFIRENILQITICSVKNKCNSDGVVNISFSLSLSLSLSLFYLYVNIFIEIFSNDFFFPFIHLHFFFSSKTHKEDKKEKNMRMQHDQKQRRPKHTRKNNSNKAWLLLYSFYVRLLFIILIISIRRLNSYVSTKKSRVLFLTYLFACNRIIFTFVNLGLFSSLLHANKFISIIVLPTI